MLSTFFEDITSDNYNNDAMGEGLNFTEDWILPPQLMGTATSFGQQPTAPLESPVHGLPPGGFHDLIPPPSSSMMAPPPPPPPPPTSHPSLGQQASADVLAAATLLQNGSLSRARSVSRTHAFPSRNTGPPMGPPVGHLRHQPMADFREDGRRMSQRHLPPEHDAFAGIMFGSPAGTIPPRVNQQVDVQWGSDANFGRHFVPQSEKETSEALEEERLVYMGCLEVNTSAANSRPSSPTRNGDLSPPKLRTRIGDQIKHEDDMDAPARKRRKSKAKEESQDVDEDASGTGSKATRKRRPKADYPASTSPASRDGSGRRRKSVANAASKAARENLTEEQKRENHIRSEQKRRTLIKEGFDDLCDIVPGLKGGGFSKSTMLTMSAEWLEDLLKGNEQLKAQLAELQGC